MRKNSITPAASTEDTDLLRRDFCHKLATGLHAGAYGLLVRFLQRGSTFVDAWFYLYCDHEWHKQRDFTVNVADIAELFLQLEMVASRDMTDGWGCRRTDHHDHVDFELKFHPDVVRDRLDRDLESYLMGRLFFGHHDSGQDSRRRIRFQGP